MLKQNKSTVNPKGSLIGQVLGLFFNDHEFESSHGH